MKLNKLCRKHGALQNEVDEIWGIIISSGIQKQDYGNKTRTDDLGINAQELIAKVDGTLTTIQGLKTEVEHLSVSSRNGLKHEKSWQREAIKNITQVYDDFQTGMNKEKQSIRAMQENNQQKLNNIETENRELRNIITEVQNDHKKLQNAYEQINRELIKLQAATLTTTCDGDWKHFNGHCYLVVPRDKSWDGASAYCSSKNSYLLEITTDTERKFVTELVRDYRGYWFWTGATDRDTTGRFIYYHSKLPIPEKYWYKGEPNNLGGNEHCVEMNAFVELYDADCRDRTRFVCEKSAA